MKRLLCALALLLGAALPAQGQVVGMDIQPLSSTVTLGSQFDVTVRVLAGTNQIDGAAAFVNYDTAVLSAISITPGASLSVVLQNTISTPGQADYAAGTFSTFPTGTFTLATMRFQANAVSAGTFLDLNVGPDPRTSQATFGGNAYQMVLANAGIIVVAPTETPTGGRPTNTPTETPTSGTPAVPTPICGQVIIEEDTPAATATVTRTATPTPTRVPPICCGDCNHDLSVSDAEVTTCSNIFTGAEPLNDCPDCDCNSDGTVRSDELTRIALNHPACRTDTPTPTPTSSRQDCCECPEANCSIPPVNGTCPQGCTLVPNACCNCGGGGEVGRTPTPVCCGDCNGDSQVRNNELTLAIDINNGSQPIAACPPANCDGLDGVSDNDLSIIAGNFTNGCPATRTPGGSTAAPRPTTTPTQVRGQ